MSSPTSDWRVRPYEPADQDEWDRLVGAARAPHFFFYRDYIDYHADRFVDASLVLYEGTRLMALFPANLDGKAVRSHGGLTFGGFVTDRRMTSQRMLKAMEATLAHYRAQGAARLVYLPVPHIYHVVPAEEDLYAIVRNGGVLVRRDLSSVIALHHRIEKSENRLRSLKRAKASGLELVRSHDWRGFMELEEAVLRERHGVAPAHSCDEMELLASRFRENIALYTVLRRGRLVAGIVVYATPVVAHAQYIGASEEGRTVGALDLLTAHLLDEVYADLPYFDFGISTEDDGRHLNLGLIRNKESYGARAVAYDRYEIAL